MTLRIMLGIALMGGAAALGCGRSTDTADDAPGPDYRGIELVVPLEKPDFILADTDGHAFDFSDRTAGRLTLLFFGYTHCPDVCPIHMANIAAVLRDLGRQARARVRVVFVTTDPERDTGRVIRAWLDRFDTDFIGLRGTLEEVNAIQSRLNLANAVREPAAEGDDYTVGHAAQVVAFMPDGAGRLVYPFGTRQADWAHDLRLLLGGTDAELPAPPLEAGAAWRFGSLAITDVLLAESLDGRQTVLYLEVRNSGSEPDTLFVLATPLAARVTLHQTTVDGSMAPVVGAPVPAGGALRLAPRGIHGMLTGIRAPLVVGATVPIELTFARAGDLLIRAEVVRYEDLDRRVEGVEDTGC